MRLAQLARKLSVKSSDIIHFLSTQAIVLEDTANTKVEDEHVRLVVSHFSPGLFDAPPEVTLPAEVQMAEMEPEKMEEPDAPVNQRPIETEEVIDEVQDVQPIMANEASEELPAIIRVPKIELSGLKVVGKIDLPEKKKKEELVQEELISENSAVIEKKVVPLERSKRNDRKPKSQLQSSRNSLAEKRERERKAEEEKRKQEIERRKEIRTQNYLKKVQVNAPVKRSKSEQPPETPAASTTKYEQPKTLWGKFVQWLTTY